MPTIAPPKCVECQKPLKAGDHYVMTMREDRPRRVWHVACFDESYTDLKEWKLYQRPSREMRADPKPPKQRS